MYWQSSVHHDVRSTVTNKKNIFNTLFEAPDRTSHAPCQPDDVGTAAVYATSAGDAYRSLAQNSCKTKVYLREVWWGVSRKLTWQVNVARIKFDEKVGNLIRIASFPRVRFHTREGRAGREGNL